MLLEGEENVGCFKINNEDGNVCYVAGAEAQGDDEGYKYEPLQCKLNSIFGEISIKKGMRIGNISIKGEKDFEICGSKDQLKFDKIEGNFAFLKEIEKCFNINLLRGSVSTLTRKDNIVTFEFKKGEDISFGLINKTPFFTCVKGIESISFDMKTKQILDIKMREEFDFGAQKEGLFSELSRLKSNQSESNNKLVFNKSVDDEWMCCDVGLSSFELEGKADTRKWSISVDGEGSLSFKKKYDFTNGEFETKLSSIVAKENKELNGECEFYGVKLEVNGAHEIRYVYDDPECKYYEILAQKEQEKDSFSIVLNDHAIEPSGVKIYENGIIELTVPSCEKKINIPNIIDNGYGIESIKLDKDGNLFGVTAVDHEYTACDAKAMGLFGVYRFKDRELNLYFGHGVGSIEYDPSAKDLNGNISDHISVKSIKNRDKNIGGMILYKNNLDKDYTIVKACEFVGECGINEFNIDCDSYVNVVETTVSGRQYSVEKLLNDPSLKRKCDDNFSEMFDNEYEYGFLRKDDNGEYRIVDMENEQCIDFCINELSVVNVLEKNILPCLRWKKTPFLESKISSNTTFSIEETKYGMRVNEIKCGDKEFINLPYRVDEKSDDVYVTKVKSCSIDHKKGLINSDSVDGSKTIQLNDRFFAEKNTDRSLHDNNHIITRNNKIGRDEVSYKANVANTGRLLQKLEALLMEKRYSGELIDRMREIVDDESATEGKIKVEKLLEKITDSEVYNLARSIIDNIERLKAENLFSKMEKDLYYAMIQEPANIKNIEDKMTKEKNAINKKNAVNKDKSTIILEFQKSLKITYYHNGDIRCLFDSGEYLSYDIDFVNRWEYPSGISKKRLQYEWCLFSKGTFSKHVFQKKGALPSAFRTTEKVDVKVKFKVGDSECEEIIKGVKQLCFDKARNVCGINMHGVEEQDCDIRNDFTIPSKILSQYGIKRDKDLKVVGFEFEVDKDGFSTGVLKKIQLAPNEHLEGLECNDGKIRNFYGPVEISFTNDKKIDYANCSDVLDKTQFEKGLSCEKGFIHQNVERIPEFKCIKLEKKQDNRGIYCIPYNINDFSFGKTWIEKNSDGDYVLNYLESGACCSLFRGDSIKIDEDKHGRVKATFDFSQRTSFDDIVVFVKEPDIETVIQLPQKVTLEPDGSITCDGAMLPNFKIEGIKSVDSENVYLSLSKDAKIDPDARLVGVIEPVVEIKRKELIDFAATIYAKDVHIRGNDITEFTLEKDCSVAIKDVTQGTKEGDNRIILPAGSRVVVTKNSDGSRRYEIKTSNLLRSSLYYTTNNESRQIDSTKKIILTGTGIENFLKLSVASTVINGSIAKAKQSMVAAAPSSGSNASLIVQGEEKYCGEDGCNINTINGESFIKGITIDGGKGSRINEIVCERELTVKDDKIVSFVPSKKMGLYYNPIGHYFSCGHNISDSNINLIDLTGHEVMLKSLGKDSTRYEIVGFDLRDDGVYEARNYSGVFASATGTFFERCFLQGRGNVRIKRITGPDKNVLFAVDTTCEVCESNPGSKLMSRATFGDDKRTKEAWRIKHEDNFGYCSNGELANMGQNNTSNEQVTTITNGAQGRIENLKLKLSSSVTLSVDNGTQNNFVGQVDLYLDGAMFECTPRGNEVINFITISNDKEDKLVKDKLVEAGKNIDTIFIVRATQQLTVQAENNKSLVGRFCINGVTVELKEDNNVKDIGDNKISFVGTIQLVTKGGATLSIAGHGQLTLYVGKYINIRGNVRGATLEGTHIVGDVSGVCKRLKFSASTGELYEAESRDNKATYLKGTYVITSKKINLDGNESVRCIRRDFNDEAVIECDVKQGQSSKINFEVLHPNNLSDEKSIVVSLQDGATVVPPGNNKEKIRINKENEVSCDSKNAKTEMINKVVIGYYGGNKVSIEEKPNEIILKCCENEKGEKYYEVYGNGEKKMYFFGVKTRLMKQDGIEYCVLKYDDPSKLKKNITEKEKKYLMSSIASGTKFFVERDEGGSAVSKIYTGDGDIRIGVLNENGEGVQPDLFVYKIAKKVDINCGGNDNIKLKLDKESVSYKRNNEDVISSFEVYKKERDLSIEKNKTTLGRINISNLRDIQSGFSPKTFGEGGLFCMYGVPNGGEKESAYYYLEDKVKAITSLRNDFNIRSDKEIGSTLARIGIGEQVEWKIRKFVTNKGAMYASRYYDYGNNESKCVTYGVEGDGHDPLNGEAFVHNRIIKVIQDDGIGFIDYNDSECAYGFSFVENFNGIKRTETICRLYKDITGKELVLDSTMPIENVSIKENGEFRLSVNKTGCLIVNGSVVANTVVDCGSFACSFNEKQECCEVNTYMMYRGSSITGKITFSNGSFSKTIDLVNSKGRFLLGKDNNVLLQGRAGTASIGDTELVFDEQNDIIFQVTPFNEVFYDYNRSYEERIEAIKEPKPLWRDYKKWMEYKKECDELPLGALNEKDFKNGRRYRVHLVCNGGKFKIDKNYPHAEKLMEHFCAKDVVIMREPKQYNRSRKFANAMDSGLEDELDFYLTWVYYPELESKIDIKGVEFDFYEPMTHDSTNINSILGGAVDDYFNKDEKKIIENCIDFPLVLENGDVTINNDSFKHCVNNGNGLCCAEVKCLTFIPTDGNRSPKGRMHTIAGKMYDDEAKEVIVVNPLNGRYIKASKVLYNEKGEIKSFSVDKDNTPESLCFYLGNAVNEDGGRYFYLPEGALVVLKGNNKYEIQGAGGERGELSIRMAIELENCYNEKGEKVRIKVFGRTMKKKKTIFKDDNVGANFVVEKIDDKNFVSSLRNCATNHKIRAEDGESFYFKSDVISSPNANNSVRK